MGTWACRSCPLALNPSSFSQSGHAKIPDGVTSITPADLCFELINARHDRRGSFWVKTTMLIYEAEMLSIHQLLQPLRFSV